MTHLHLNLKISHSMFWCGVFCISNSQSKEANLCVPSQKLQAHSFWQKNSLFIFTKILGRWNLPNMYEEVEIPMASNLRPLSDKTLVSSNLWTISVSSNVDVFYFYTRFKIITHKIRSFNDVLLFSIKAKYVENNKYSQKRE